MNENDNDDEEEIKLNRYLKIENQLKSKKNEFSLIELLIENELLVSNENLNNINHYYNLLINNK